MTTPPASPHPPPPWLEGLPPPRRRPRWQRVLKWTAISLVTLLVLVAAFAYIDYRHLNGQITKAPIQINGPRPPKVATHAENFVLIGSDTRAGASGKGTGAGNVQGARSDTTIIMHIAANSSGATLISIPRDSYVQIPACKIGPHGQMSAPTVGKFNEAFSIGSNAGNQYGPSCTIHTIESLTDIHIDHYAVVDFAGFKRMVDALGGVRMCVAQPLDDPIEYVPGVGYHGSGLNLPAGKNVKIDGDQALALMRARYALDGGGDLPRIKRQQLFIGAMIRKATSTGLLVHPFELQHFLDAATKSLTTDGFGLGTMRTLAGALHKTGAGGVRILTVPLDATLPPGVPSADVAWDPVRSAELWSAIRDDRPIPGTVKASPSPSPSPSATKSGPRLSVPPSAISVNVLNGSGVPGAAAKAAADLAAEGFHTTVGGDASSFDYSSTVVEYGTSRVQSSQTVAAAIPGAERRADSTLGTTVTVIVGSNYSGTRPVTISSTSTSSTPTPSATPSIPSQSAATPGCLS